MTKILDTLTKPKHRAVVMSVREIGKTFIEGGQPLTILCGGGFDLHAGEIIALVGPSGCGKSTLLQCVGLLEKPTKGHIYIGDAAVVKMDENTRTRVRRDELGFVYQRHNLLDDFSALENVMMPMLTAGVSDTHAEIRAKKLLKSVNILHRATHRPGEMSGGEQQRTAVARALANNPSVILADEPTGSLDPKHAKVLFDLLLKQVRDNKLAMLFVTHDMTLAKRADRIITIKNGIVG
ncbi:MAG: ABC transporter ATP-binding protein [Alphaproteobacteria bacterium]|nr:ABC transporter ATP-binding protein [Alphaproteobacteria bacterium]